MIELNSKTILGTKYKYRDVDYRYQVHDGLQRSVNFEVKFTV